MTKNLYIVIKGDHSWRKKNTSGKHIEQIENIIES